jgi:hypothetical protein
MALADRTPRLRRASPLILGAGAVAAYLVARPHLPHDHAVLLRFERACPSAERVDAAWFASEDGTGEPSAGSSHSFPRGAVPREVQANVRLPHGPTWLELSVRASGASASSRRRVALGDGVTHVPIPCPSAAEP